ncbi:MAG: YcnI family protein [Solirubrobacterales bacterium]
MRRITISLIAALTLAAVPAAASAHVSLHPNEVPTGSYATLQLRVPNESEDANTVKVAVQLPSGFTDVSPEFMPGWTPKVRTVKLAEPVQSDDGPITEGVREIVWEGKGTDGKIPPGQFLNFSMSTEIPGKAGSTLTFKVLQYYDDGEVARWIGPPDSEEPAPDIDVTEAGGVLQDVAGSEADAPTAGEASATASEAGAEGAATSSESSSGSSDKGLAIAALVIAVIALLVAGAAVLTTRRRPA